uniref:MULE transposase domain-containing protein n=1 Tax=Lactuca sativa TaxID=4236 RepID=A0A9R1WZB5_LACSA|nr:hypothetical protein LSAT_V11C800394080 [Lactuca sativa]
MESPSHIDVVHVSPPRIESPIEVESVKKPNMEPPIMEPYSEALGGSSDSEGSGDSSDSDFIVDEDNLLDDPEVDMHDFYLNIDDNLEWVGDAHITTENVAMSDEEMEMINTDVLQFKSSSDEGQISKRRNKIPAAERVQINDAAQVSDPFYILQTFSSSQEAKDRIYLHAIETRRELDIVKNDKNRVRVVCKGTILDMGILETSRKGGPSKTSGKGGPNKKKSAVKVDESNKCPWKLLVMFRAKAKSLETIRGDFGGQYSILRDYLLEVQSRNPNTTIKLQVDNSSNPASDTRIFRRFAAGKREFLGLDGAFMKGPYPGMILTAVGLDGNNCTYPVAYGVVESENYSSWTWFLKNLGDDLDLSTNSNFTFITDRQKGVLPAIAKLFPCAENRFCLRHIHENMKRKWRGKEFKDCLWKCATTSTVQQFNHAMEELKKLNNDAYEWLKAIPPQHWSRSHFTGRTHCDALLNNLCETLNIKLVKGRDKPIISCLEFIREYIMKKLVIIQKTIDKCYGPLTPTATKTIKKIKCEAAEYRAVFCGNGKYQVTGGEGVDQCVTGIPCKHTIAAIWDMRRYNENVGIPETWVHPTYWLKTWQEMYAFKIEPINGRMMWAKSPCPTKLLPPKHHVPIGRPKKKRRRSATEDDGAIGTRTVRCSKYGNVGHNGRSCKGQTVGGSQANGSDVGHNSGAMNKGKSMMV